MTGPNTVHAPGVHIDPRGIGLDLLIDPSTLGLIRAGLSPLYQCHFATNPIVRYGRLCIDRLGAGAVAFEAPDRPGVHPVRTETPDGLTLSIDRPATANDAPAIGHFAAVNVGPTIFNSLGQLYDRPRGYALFATFRRPVQDPFSDTVGVDGTWAPAVLARTGGTQIGASCQFQANGKTRLNIPGLGPVDRPEIDLETLQRITGPTHSLFTLVLKFNRMGSPNGTAYLFVGQDVIDSYPFDFPEPLTWRVDRVLAGIGTATGAGYTASVDLVDLQIWCDVGQLSI